MNLPCSKNMYILKNKLIGFLFCVMHKNLNYHVCRPFEAQKPNMWPTDCLQDRSRAQMAKQANCVRQTSRQCCTKNKKIIVL